MYSLLAGRDSIEYGKHAVMHYSVLFFIRSNTVFIVIEYSEE